MIDISKELRQLLIDNRIQLRELIPTERQAVIIKLVETERLTDSTAVADKLNITVQNAATALKKLWGLGHIERLYVGDPTDGNLYKYTPLAHSPKD